MNARTVILTGFLLLLGGLGGWLAQVLHWPMPWMIGSLAASALAVAGLQKGLLSDYGFPMPLRSAFVALIGVMIGTQVTPDLLGQIGALPWTVTGLAVYVVAAHGGNYLIFRRFGGQDRPTAFYAGTPGGLMESILMGEAAGADSRVVTLQHFLRIVLVITLLPLGLSLYLGAPVGSAAGLSAAAPDGVPVPVSTLALIAAAAAVGLKLGEVIRLPAAQITGPLLLAAGFTLSGLVDLHLPFWLIATAQVVIGTSLGLRFKGIAAPVIRAALKMAVLSVAFMLVLGAALAEALALITGIPFLHLAISLAPGGVTEMSVIALSLAANPALVSLHHVLRILMTVLEMSLLARWIRPGPG